MKLSKFTKLIKIDKDIYAVFNSLFMKILFVDKDKKNQIQEMSTNDKETQILFDNGIYINEEGNDEKVFQIIKNNIINHSKKISIMYLNISTYCNLACKYCFIDHNPLSVHDRRLMSFETAKNALDKFKKEIYKNKEQSIAQVILYGGEPLSNNNEFDKIVQYARHIMPKVKITLITNGTLLNKNKIQFLKSLNIVVGLSLDGPKNINDKSRVFKSSNESVYDAVAKKIPCMNEEKLLYGLSSTITKELIENKKEVVKCFKDLQVHDVFFNLYHYSQHVCKSEWTSFYNNMSNFILKINKDLKNIGIEEGRVRDQINLLAKEIFKFQSCGAVGLNQITIQPNGDVCICQGDSRTSKYVIGNINTDEIKEMLNSPKVEPWTKYYTVCKEKCKKCAALFVCGGGCPLQAEALFGSREEMDAASCIFYKKFLKWYLKEYYLKIKGGENVNRA